MLKWNRAWRGISAGAGLSPRGQSTLLRAAHDGEFRRADRLLGLKVLLQLLASGDCDSRRDTDGNPETEPDSNWIGLVVAPNHPEYPAAHGCFSAASNETLKFFFRTDEYDFFIESKVAGLANPVRHYRMFSQALRDALDARVFGGMHYRNSTHVGAIIGKHVSRFATWHFFRPSRGRGAPGPK